MWVPVAISDQVTANKPLGVSVGDQGLVLFRDKSDRICVLEDRCPHRRVPLSLGKVIEGNLRCAYHGWTFEGQGGQCVKIPNLGDNEKLSPQLRADAFIPYEQNGFVYLLTGTPATEPSDIERNAAVNSTPSDLLHPNPNLVDALQQNGRAVISCSADTYLRALLDGPHLLLSLAGVCITDFFLGDVVHETDTLQLDRTAIWTHKLKPHESKWGVSTLVLRTEVYPDQSAARLQLLDVGERPLVNILLAVVPGKRNTVQINWRCLWLANYADIAPYSVRWRISASHCPLQIHEKINGSALADLLPGPSVHLLGNDAGKSEILAATSEKESSEKFCSTSPNVTEESRI